LIAEKGYRWTKKWFLTLDQSNDQRIKAGSLIVDLPSPEKGFQGTEVHTEEQKKMVKDVHFWRLYQAGFIGFQYFCFNCIKSCPVGQ
jgi:hypothetical protein